MLTIVDARGQCVIVVLPICCPARTTTNRTRAELEMPALWSTRISSRRDPPARNYSRFTSKNGPDTASSRRRQRRLTKTIGGARCSAMACACTLHLRSWCPRPEELFGRWLTAPMTCSRSGMDDGSVTVRTPEAYMPTSAPQPPGGWFATPAEELDAVRVSRACNRILDEDRAVRRRDGHDLRRRAMWRRVRAKALATTRRLRWH